MTADDGDEILDMPRDEMRRAACDALAYRVLSLMIEHFDASLPMALYRLLTCAAANAVSVGGRTNAAAAFRHVADKIEAGVFGEIERSQARH